MSAILEHRAPVIAHTDLMLATPGKLFSSRGWLYELKYDGFRCLITKRGDVVRLDSRTGRDMARCFPELVDELRPIPHDFVTDGELVMLDEQGRPQWDRLRERHVLKDERAIRRASVEKPAAIFAFDLLVLDGADFRPRPLLQRKTALHGVLPGHRRIRYAGHFADDCKPLWQMAVEMELEGIIAKDAASIYTPWRTTRWQNQDGRGCGARTESSTQVDALRAPTVRRAGLSRRR